MTEINRYHKEMLDQSVTYGLNLTFLRVKYRLPYVIKLFKYLKKETKKKLSVIEPIFPKNFIDTEPSRTDYIDNLEEAGIELKISSIDLIDEETGEIVKVLYFKFKPIKRR